MLGRVANTWKEYAGLVHLQDSGSIGIFSVAKEEIRSVRQNQHQALFGIERRLVSPMSTVSKVLLNANSAKT